MIYKYACKTLYIWALLAFFGSFFVTASQEAHAQNTYKRGAPSLSLNSKHNTFELLPDHVRIFKDPGQKLNSANLLKKFESGEGETVTNRQVVKFGYQNDPVWVVFRIQNNNFSQSKWFLYLGSFADYVQGTSDRIAFFDLNYNTPLMMDGRTINNKRQLFDQGLNAIPFSIKPSTSKTFAIYLEPTPGLATFLPLRIINEEAYKNTQYKNDLSRNVLYMCTVLLFLLFVIFVFLYKDPLPMFLCGYLVTHYMMFMNNGELISVGNDSNIEFNAVLYAVCYLTAGLVCLSTLWNIPTEQKKSSLIILGLMGLTTIAGVGSYFLDSAIFLTLATRILPIVAPLVLAVALFFSSVAPNLKGSIGTFIFAWLFLFVAAVLTELAKIDLLSFGLFQTHFYWIALPFQIMILSFSTIKIMQMSKDLNEIRNAEQHKQEDTERQMQKSKEIADQERLVNILQRERELLAELREREAERAVAMREAKEIADQANKAKSAFLAVISHEIRTPMTGIMGMIRLINRTPLNETQTEYIQTIESSGDTLLALLNDILDLSKVEEGKMQIEMINFNLVKLLKSVALLMTGRADEQGLDLKIEMDEGIPEVLVGDPTRIRQILLNLISNAIKFTKKGHVTIECRLEELVNNTYHIHLGVRDTGIGLDEETQKKLFTPFTQADASISRQYGGTGLGLTICKKLVNAMNGDIQIKSTPGMGSTFYFILPFEIGYGDAEESVEAKNIYVPPMDILVADDNEVNQKVVRSLLEHENHRITTVGEGLKAIQMLEQQHYDVIFMDMEMPGLSGIETTLKIRALTNPEKAKTPIFAMTANTMQEDIQKCFDAGMNDYVSKPIDPDKLSEVLFNLVDNKLSDKESIRQARLKAEAEAQEQAQQPVTTAAPTAPIEEPAPIVQVEAPVMVDPVVSEAVSTAPTTEETQAVQMGTIETVQPTPEINSSLAAPKSMPATPAPEDVAIDPTPSHQIPALEPTEEVTNKTLPDTIESLQLETPQAETPEATEGVDLSPIGKLDDADYGIPSPATETPLQQTSALPPQDIASAPQTTAPITEAQETPVVTQQTAPSVTETTPETPPVIESAPVATEVPVETPPAAEPVPAAAVEIDMSNLLFDDAVLGGLKDSLGGEAILDMMQDLYTTSDDLIDKAEQSLSEGDITAVGHRAHDLKGMCANFGLTGVSDIAAAIEHGARNDAPVDEITSFVQKLRPNYEQMKAQLVIWLKD